MIYFSSQLVEATPESIIFNTITFICTLKYKSITMLFYSLIIAAAFAVSPSSAFSSPTGTSSGTFNEGEGITIIQSLGIWKISKYTHFWYVCEKGVHCTMKFDVQ